jgi:hypothetical protein
MGGGREKLILISTAAIVIMGKALTNAKRIIPMIGFFILLAPSPSFWKRYLSEAGRLFDDQIILYGFDAFYAPSKFTCLIHGPLRINEAAQLNGALEGFNADLEGLDKIVLCDQGFDLGRDDGIVNVLSGALMGAGRCTGCKGGDEHKKQQRSDNEMSLVHGD